MRVEHQLVNQSDPSTNQNVERTQLLKMSKIKIYFLPLTSKYVLTELNGSFERMVKSYLKCEATVWFISEPRLAITKAWK